MMDADGSEEVLSCEVLKREGVDIVNEVLFFLLFLYFPLFSLS